MFYFVYTPVDNGVTICDIDSQIVCESRPLPRQECVYEKHVEKGRKKRETVCVCVREREILR